MVKPIMLDRMRSKLWSTIKSIKLRRNSLDWSIFIEFHIYLSKILSYLIIFKVFTFRVPYAHSGVSSEFTEAVTVGDYTNHPYSSARNRLWNICWRTHHTGSFIFAVLSEMFLSLFFSFKLAHQSKDIKPWIRDPSPHPTGPPSRWTIGTKYGF